MKGIPVTIAVEGIVDSAVVRRLLGRLDIPVGRVHDTRGAAKLDKRLKGYNQAAVRTPWLVVRDLDRAACAPTLCQNLLPTPSKHMTFRIAVRAIEAWLLADRERLAAFLHVSSKRIPAVPEAVADPKQAMVDLARRSESSEVCRLMVPAVGSGRVGPGYTGHLIAFASQRWEPLEAAKQAPSLARCIRALEPLRPR